jgi:hypothetical protein
METNQFQQEISIIKEMIEKTRKDAAGSGNFWVALGILSILNTLLIMFLQTHNLGRYVLPVLIGYFILIVLTALLMSGLEEKKAKVETYAKQIFGQLGLSCVIPTLMLFFLFPLTKVYSFELVPVFCSLIVGILIFTAGAIFEVRFVKWCSLVWWIGAAAMAYSHDLTSGWIMIATIIFGMILPGFLFNRQYKNRSRKNES